MNLNIEWTPVALQSLDEVYEYTFEEFGKAQVRKLTKQIYSDTIFIEYVRNARLDDATVWDRLSAL